MARPRVIICAGTSEADRAVREHLEAWSAQGWLRDFLWTTGREKSDQSTSVCISNGGAEPCDVVGFLADEARLVRLVSAQLVPTGEDGSETRRKSADLADFIEGLYDQATHRFIRIGVIIPSIDTPHVLAPEMIDSRFEVTVLVSPEDRSGREGLRVPIDSGAQFSAHAAFGLACLAGLWVGCDTGMFDELPPGSGPPPVVTVAVSAARLVRGLLTVDDVTVGLLDLTESLPEDPFAVRDLFDAIPAQDEERLVERLAAAAHSVIGNQELVLRPPPRGSRPTKTTVSFAWFALDFLRFLWAMVREAPNHAIERIVSKAERAVQRVPGEDAYFEIRWGGRRRDGDGDATLDEITEDVKAALTALAPDMHVADTARPDLWRDLRSLCFGLVDRGEFPAGVSAPMEGGKRLLISNRELIAPRPDAEQRSIAEVLSVPVPADGPFAEVLPLVDPRRLAEIRHLAATSNETPSDQSQQGGANPSLVIDAAQRLDEIEHLRGQSLLWRLAAATSAELQEAMGQAEGASSTIATIERDVDQDRKAFVREPRILRWTRRLSTVLVVILAVAPAVLHSLVSGSLLTKALDFLETFGLVGGVGLSLTSFYGFVWPLLWRAALIPISTRILSWFVNIVRQYQIKRKFDAAPAEVEHAKDLLRHYLSEVHRMSCVYNRFVEWGAAIAWHVHRPFGPPPQRQLVVGLDASSQVRLPRSARLMEAGSSEARVRQLTTELAGKLLKPGWLATSFEQATRSAILGVRLELGSSIEKALPSLDNSIGGADVRRFTESLASPAFGQSQAASFRARVAEELEAKRPEELFDSAREVVLQDGRGDFPPTGSQPDVVAFLRGLLAESRGGAGPELQIGEGVGIGTDAAVRDHLLDRSATYIWAPDANLDEGQATDVLRSPVQPVVTGLGTLLVVSVRVDRTDPIETGSIALFAPRGGSGTPGRGPQLTSDETQGPW